MTVACSALVSSPLNRKPYNKHVISLIFSVRTVNYASSFFQSGLLAWINLYRLDSATGFSNNYPLDSDLSGG